MIFFYGGFFVLGFNSAAIESPFLLIACYIYIFAVMIPSLAVAVRRMHDVGKSGWYMLIPIYSFILAITEGEKGTNQYGPDPKSADNEEINTIGTKEIE